MQSAKNDLYSCNINTQSTLEKITDTNGANNYKKIQIFTKYKPNSLFEILRMDIVLERISHRTIEKLSVMSSEISTFYNNLFDKNDNYKDFVSKARLYDTTLHITFKLIDHEIKFMQDSISFNNLDSLVKNDSSIYACAKKYYGISLP